MSAEGWTLIIGAIFAGLTGVTGLYVKWAQQKAKDTVDLFNGHIDRLQREIESNQRQVAQKQEAIDELAYLQTRCEIREEASYGWMLRAKEHMDRFGEELQALGRPPMPSLELPPKALGSDADRAAYLQRRSAFNTALSAAVSNATIQATNHTKDTP